MFLHNNPKQTTKELDLVDNNMDKDNICRMSLRSCCE